MRKKKTIKRFICTFKLPKIQICLMYIYTFVWFVSSFLFPTL